MEHKTIYPERSLMLNAIELELKHQIDLLAGSQTASFREMLAYHMGWKYIHAGSHTGGKRIRPLLLLLVTAAVGGQWRKATPAAAALEIVHNFSLIHDDIQDNSPTRRGRPTFWKRYGIPMAINGGDALFAIANLGILRVQKSFPASKVVKVAGILHAACLELTIGQFLDLHYQNTGHLSNRNYWPMVEGKTAALLAAGAQIGAILGGAKDRICRKYRDFGRRLGVAFQIQDDILGIWGSEVLTGKSTASDLIERKPSLPVLYGLSRHGRFSRVWATSRIGKREAVELKRLLTQENAYEYSMSQARQWTNGALNTLRALKPQGDAGKALTDLAVELLGRET